jgi:energy-coupling factor transporter ATP-binding protein EcfA2
MIGVDAATSSQAAALDALRAWWRDAAAGSLALLIGPAGSGISRTVRHLHRMLDPDAATVRILDTPEGRRSDAQLLKDAIAAFGVAPIGRTGLELQTVLRETLATLAERGPRPLLVIDNGPLAGSQLEIIRAVLTGSPAGILIAGQPDLAIRIGRRPALQAALGIAVTLDPLAGDAIGTPPDDRAIQTRLALPGFTEARA